jgi:hypothetical protein
MTRTHVILDASAVAPYFIPHAHRSGRVHTISFTLIEAVRKRSAANDVVLHVPNVCIPEVFGTFAKYAYGNWNHQVKRTITPQRYEKIRAGFRRYMHNSAVFEQYDLNRYHILATDLIAPVDHRYQIRKKKGARQVPMSAVDHVVVGMGIYQARVHGEDSAVILTADRRMCDGVRRATTMKPAIASSMGLPQRAAELGYDWASGIYPRMVHLPTVGDSDLASLFGIWPLSTRKPAGVAPRTMGI